MARSWLAQLLCSRRNGWQCCRRRQRLFTTDVQAAHSRVIADVGAKAWNLHFQEGRVFTEHLDFVSGKESGATPLFRVLDLEGEVAAPQHMPELSAEQCRALLRNMLRSNTMDSVMYDAQRQGRVSFHMTQFGEEGAVTACAAALNPQDMVYGQYREAGLLLWRGFSMNSMLAQCVGSIDDRGKGRQMPVHYGSREHHFQTISSPLSTQIPQAAGAGYALRLGQKDRIVCCFFGEGAASEGDFHAGLNFAATLRCHTLFFCRNNGFAISTPAGEQYAGDGIHARGVGYGIPSVRVDGNDLLACYAAVKRAREIIVGEHQPVLIEAMTYRGGHHSTSDDSTRYRSKGEMDFWLQNLSPIRRFTKYCTARGLWTKEETEQVRKEAREEAIAALDNAERKPKWPAVTLFEDVFAEMPPHLLEQRAELQEHLERHPQEYPPQGGSHH
eukprot:GGOE01061864.1.p2 GENE.GGOE01061864.1~~GGOE01061864.1.p2  ORF type:complete len:455 (-),score=91.17 GGOE01061864.1:213-1541(-)